jgi:glutathione S-transferase/GST-like protein
MITFYYNLAPNPTKVALCLEEMGLPYDLVPVDTRKGEQHAPSFLALNPNAKVPVIVDHDAEGGPLRLTESAAILVYLAEKTGKLLPRSGHGRARVFEQLFFHASALGVAFGNAGYFRKLAPDQIPLAIDRYGQEAQRLITLLDALLARQPFVAGDDLSIADIAHFGWLWRREFAGVSLDAAPNVQRYIAQLQGRPAFARAIDRTTALAAV